MKTKEDKTLTKAEMEIMNYLWEMKNGGTVRDVLACYPEPLPAYTTTATFLKILTEKGFVRAEKRENEGKTLFFVPLITRQEYTRSKMQEVKKDFFGGSFRSMINFFAKEENLSDDELKEILETIKTHP